MRLRALTLRHPWPFAICHLGKDCENREWDDRLARLNEIHAQLGQQIAIHGGSAPVRPRRKHWLELAADNPWRQLCEALEAWQTAPELMTQAAADYLHAHRAGEPLRPEHFVMPGIVAVATVQRVTRTSASRWAVPGDLHIELSEVTVLPQPVACPGSQGLWSVPPAIEGAVRRQLLGWSMAQVPVESGRDGAAWVR